MAPVMVSSKVLLNLSSYTGNQPDNPKKILYAKNEMEKELDMAGIDN